MSVAEGEHALTARQLHVVVTLGFCGLVSAADNWFISPALPAIAQTLAVAPTAAMIILTAYMLPYGALQPVCGAIGDAVGRLRLLRVIVLGLCAGTLLCAVAPSLAVLVLARVVTGCFAAGIISVSQAFVGDAVGPERRAGAVGILMGITFTGQGLSAGLGGILTDLVGWRAAFAAFGALAFAAWLGLSTLREPALAPAAAVSGRAGSSEAAEVPGSAPGSAAPGTPDAPSSAVSAASASSQPLRPVAPAANPVATFFRNALGIFFGPRRAVFLLALATGILFLGTYGFMGTFLSELCGLSSTAAGLLMMFYGVFCLVGGSLSGSLGARRQRRHGFRPSVRSHVWDSATSWCSRRLSPSPWRRTRSAWASARGSSALASLPAAAWDPCWAVRCSPRVATWGSGSLWRPFCWCSSS